MTYETGLAYAAMQLMVDLGLVPTNAINVSGAAAGATQLTSATAPTGFLQQGVLWIFDGTGEPPVGIDSIAGTVFTLQAPLQHDHAGGAQLATNLLDVLPAEPSIMLDSGYPVIACQVLDGMTEWATNREWQHHPRLSICHWLKLKQQGSPKVHPEVYRRNRSQLGQTNIGAIRGYLEQSPEVWIRGVSYAENITRFVTAHAESVRGTGSVPLWESYLDVYIQGNRDDVTSANP